MTTKFYVDAEGIYLGGFAGVQPPAGAVEVPEPPEDARQVYDLDMQSWGAVPLPVPEEISRRQFYQGLAVEGFITKQEAIDAMDGVLPTAIQGVINSISDEDAKFNATMLLKGATEFERSHQLVAVFAASQGLSEAEVDNFWRSCAEL